MGQPYDGYLSDRSTTFSIHPGGFVTRRCGENLSPEDVTRGWTTGYRDAVHRAVLRERGEPLDPIQTRALDLVVTKGPLSRAELYNGVIALARQHSPSGSPAKTVHESLEKIVLGPYQLIGVQG